MKLRDSLPVLMIGTVFSNFTHGFVLTSPSFLCCDNDRRFNPRTTASSIQSVFAEPYREEHATNDESLPTDTCRRRILHTAGFILLAPPLPVLAAETTADTTTAVVVDFTRRDKDFGYTIKLPETLSQPTNKPLKTHLDEVNFNGSGINVGVTVDPVRIASLKDFGTPPEVAARVVNAEVNRDGVFQVTLLEDPVELPDKSYLLQYLSEGKRGNKRNVCKIFIKDKKLYVLTAQAKEDKYSTDTEKTILGIIESFQIL